MNWTLERKLTVGFAIILGILLINALIAASCIRNLASNGRWVLHSHFVLSEIDELESGLKDAGYGVLGYVLTGRQGFLDRDRRGMEQVAHRLVLGADQRGSSRIGNVHARRWRFGRRYDGGVCEAVIPRGFIDAEQGEPGKDHGHCRDR